MTSPRRAETERILSTRQLNRALLARQHLLERSGLPLPRILEGVAGLQTQYAPSAYMGLWSRRRCFVRESLTAALEQHRAVQATLMRVTIHLTSARDFPLFAAGLRQVRRDWWLRVHAREIEGLDMHAVAGRLREHLMAGPRRATELIDLLRADGFPALAWSGAGLWLDMVRVPPSGTWERRRADLFAAADDWLGPSGAAEGEGLGHLIRRYLGGFGPAAVGDIASWSGVPPSRLGPALNPLDLRRYRDEQGRQLLDLPGASLPDPATPAPVRFLPTWDATLLVHARRAQILPEPYRGLVFQTKTPHSINTFLVDGAVAGSWRFQDGRILLQPFDGIPSTARRELHEEAGRLAAFVADPEGVA